MEIVLTNPDDQTPNPAPMQFNEAAQAEDEEMKVLCLFGFVFSFFAGGFWFRLGDMIVPLLFLHAWEDSLPKIAKGQFVGNH